MPRQEETFSSITEGTDRYQKLILDLYYVGGYTEQEIEDQTGIPRRTICRDLGATREFLRNLPSRPREADNKRV